MKRIIAMLTVAVLSILGTLSAASLDVKADAAVQAVQKSYFYPYGSTVTLSGDFGSNEFYFTIDKYWNVSDAALRLILNQSSRIDPDGISSLTVSLNGVPVQSYALKDYLTPNAQLICHFPADKLKAGSNDVKIQVYRRITTLPCADDVSVANYVHLEAGSGVNVSYSDAAPSMEISQFPYPFYRVQSGDQSNTVVASPDKADKSRLASVLELSSYLGGQATSRDYSVETLFWSQIHNPQDKDIVYAGNSAGLPSGLLSSLPQGANLDSGAVIKLVQSIYNPGHLILLVVSNNDSDLERAVKFLQNPQLVGQAQSSYVYVDRSIDVLTKDTTQAETMSFSSLGYSGTYLYGPFRRESSMSMQLPKGAAAGSQSAITLHFRYSDNLDFTKSLATIYVNDIPIGSKKLAKGNDGNDSLTVTIPPEARRTNYFNVKIAFDLEITDQYCEKRQEQMPWAYIGGDSSIFLPPVRNQTWLFENFPAPFTQSGQWNSTVFVLPEKYGQQDLLNAGYAAQLIGRSVTSNHGTPSVAIGGSDMSGQSNLVIIGSPSRQSLIKTNNSLLYFQFNSGFNAFMSNGKLELLPAYSKNLASLQLVNSGDGKTAILALTAPDQNMVDTAAANIFKPSNFSHITGDGVLMDKKGVVYDYRFKKDAAKKPLFWAETALSSNTRIFAAITVSIIALLAIALLLFLRKQHRLKIKYTHKQ